MTQKEFNRLMAFQPDVLPAESIRELITTYFENGWGEEEAEQIAKAYFEAIRAAFVDQE